MSKRGALSKKVIGEKSRKRKKKKTPAWVPGKLGGEDQKGRIFLSPRGAEKQAGLEGNQGNDPIFGPSSRKYARSNLAFKLGGRFAKWPAEEGGGGVQKEPLWKGKKRVGSEIGGRGGNNGSPKRKFTKLKTNSGRKEKAKKKKNSH